MKTLAVVLTCLAGFCLRAEKPAALKLTTTIPLPGVKGRFDHFAIDVKGHRLFVAALGNDTVEVVDVATGKHLKSIAGLRQPTGVLYLAELNQIAVASGTDGVLKLFDGSAYALRKTAGPFEDADNVRFDAKTKSIYVGYGGGGIGIVDATTMKPSGSVPLPGHPESFQPEERGGRIFVNVPDANQVAVIDREKRVAIAAWPMKEFQANFPMALNEVDHRLFIGCRRPGRVVVLDTLAGQTVASVEISGDTDDLFYDAALQRLYASCGEGFIDVIDRRDADHYERRERIPTRSGARTSFFSAELNQYYLAVPQRDGQEAELRIFQPQK